MGITFAQPENSLLPAISRILSSKKRFSNHFPWLPIDMNKKTRWFCCLIITGILSALMTPNSLFGTEATKKSQNSNSKSNFTLTVKDNLVTLDAKDASLNQIVEEIGSRMNIDVLTRVPDENKVAIKFDNLPLKDAIERLRKYAEIVYFKDSQNQKITKIMVFPKRKEGELSKPAKEEGSVKTESKTEQILKETPQPKPFKFEFDPSKYQEGE